MKIFLIILGSYILLKLIMLIFPWGRRLARKYNDIYNLYRTYFYRGREFLDSIKLFSKQLKRKKEKRKKYAEIALNNIKEYKENLTEKQLVEYDKAKAKMQAKIQKILNKRAKKQAK